MTILHLDYETRSAADLGGVGLYRYVADPTTRVVCAAWAFDTDEPTVWDALHEPMPAVLREAITGGVTIAAWNAAFEREVTRQVLGLPVADAQVSCSMARAAAMGLPLKLERFLAVLCPDVPKDMAGHRQMQQVARPRRVDADGRIVWWDDETRLARVRAYCAQDVRGEQAADRVLRPLSASETAVWQLDQRINARGITVDVATARGARRIAEREAEIAAGRLSRLTRGAVTAPTQHGALLAWVQAQGVQTVSVDKDRVAALLADTTLPGHVRDVLTIRQETAKSSTAKLDTLLAWADPADHRARGMFQYHAAHTGRWGGRGPQPQNFTRPEKGIDVLGLLPLLGAGDHAGLGLLHPPLVAVSSSLRSMLTAAPGAMLVCYDYSAIEPRVLAWLAGQDDALDRMRSGKFVEYETMAATIYRVPVNTIAKDSAERQLSKAAVLGCGYGMGWQKFQATVAKAPYFVTIDDEMAQHVVQAYREQWRAVKQYWYDVQDAAIRAVLAPRTPVDFRGVRFVASQAWLLAKLPSGRVLTYAQPTVREVETPWGATKPALFAWGENSITRQWEEYSLYGGLMTENFVQALSRDLLTDAMLRLDAMGEAIVLHAHDEIVCESAEPARTQARMADVMMSPPSWAQGVPIAVEGWTAFRYRK